MSVNEVLDAIILGAFVTGLTVAVTRLTLRLYHYWRDGQPWPLLALRDIIAFGGLLLPFLMILTVRAFGWAEVVAGEISWKIMTGVPALIAVWTLAYFEVKVIERNRRR